MEVTKLCYTKDAHKYYALFGMTIETTYILIIRLQSSWESRNKLVFKHTCVRPCMCDVTEVHTSILRLGRETQVHPFHENP